MSVDDGSIWPTAEMDRVVEEFDGRMGFAVEDLATAETVAMESLWKEGPAIVEFGSFT